MLLAKNALNGTRDALIGSESVRVRVGVACMLKKCARKDCGLRWGVCVRACAAEMYEREEFDV